MLLKRYACVRQQDITDCGAACLGTVARQHGLKIPIIKIREIAGTDQMGTNLVGMIKAAETLGLAAKGLRGERQHLDLPLPMPCIAHVTKDNLQHYVVIHWIKNKRILVADPAEGLVYYTIDEFCAIWSGVLLLMVPTDQFQTGDETQSFLAGFGALLLNHKMLLVQMFFASVIYTLFGISGAFYLKTLVDHLLVKGISKTFHVVSIGFLIVGVFQILLDMFRNHLLVYLCQKIDVSIILNFYKHVLSLPMSFFDTRRVGEILSRLSDASKIRRAISGAVLSLMLDTLMVIFAGIILWIQNKVLFRVTIILIPLYLVVLWIFNKPYNSVQRKSMEQAADLESYFVETLNGIASIKAYSSEERVYHQAEFKFIKLIKTTFREAVLRNVQRGLQSLLAFAGEIIILWVGGLLILKGQMSIGQLLTYNALLVYFFKPVANLASLQPTLQEAYIAAERLGEILTLEKEKEKVHYKQKIISGFRLTGKIQLENVDFHYARHQFVLNDINFTIKPGEKVGLVGESGSGKTTILKLLLGFYPPKNGRILFNGYNSLDLDLTHLRECIGYVPQDIFLFNGTVLENLAFGLEKIRLEDIIALTQKTSAFNFIDNLPQRYNTIIGERGVTLSGGQRQRLAIMRALLKKPDILILDEATSNLDFKTEDAIHYAIDNYCSGITTIVVAHRLSTVMKCDKIIVLAKGKLVEMGTHKELLEKQREYSNLWSNQTFGKVVNYF